MSETQIYYKRMMAAWPKYKEYFMPFLKLVNGRDIPMEVTNHYDKLLDYTVLGGKMLRGQIVLKTFEETCRANSIEPSEEEQDSVTLYAWTIETLQAAFLISDDISDKATLRRGKKCWHLLKENEVVAINDSMHLSMLCIRIAWTLITKMNASSNTYFPYIDTICMTSLGQNIDSTTMMTDETSHYDQCSLTRLLTISENKTSQYTVTLPMGSGVYLASLLMKNSPESSDINSLFNEKVQPLCKDIGVLFQMQDDLLNILEVREWLSKKKTLEPNENINEASSSNIKGLQSPTKDSCDISEGKATWIHHRYLFRHEDETLLETGQAPEKWVEGKRDIDPEDMKLVLSNYGPQGRFDLVYNIYEKYGIIDETIKDITSYVRYIKEKIDDCPTYCKVVFQWILSLIVERKF